MEIATSAGAEGTTNRLCGSPGATLSTGDGSTASSVGIHGLALASAPRPPLRSITKAPARRASSAWRLENSGDPVKKANRTRSKLPSVTVSMTAGSPPASVSVPATNSSSTRRMSIAGKFDSSSHRFNSLPSRDDAPATATRTASLGEVMSLRDAKPDNGEPSSPNEGQGPMQQSYSQ